MNKPVRLTLTRDDLFYGSHANCGSCPVARAINRHLIDGFKALVHPRYIIIVPDEWVTRLDDDLEYSFLVETDGLVHRFVYAFDNYYSNPLYGVEDRKLVKPGYLTTLWIPEEFLHVG